MGGLRVGIVPHSLPGGVERIPRHKLPWGEGKRQNFINNTICGKQRRKKIDGGRETRDTDIP